MNGLLISLSALLLLACVVMGHHALARRMWGFLLLMVVCAFVNGVTIAHILITERNARTAAHLERELRTIEK